MKQYLSLSLFILAGAALFALGFVFDPEVMVPVLGLTCVAGAVGAAVWSVVGGIVVRAFKRFRAAVRNLFHGVGYGFGYSGVHVPYSLGAVWVAVVRYRAFNTAALGLGVRIGAVARRLQHVCYYYGRLVCRVVRAQAGLSVYWVALGWNGSARNRTMRLRTIPEVWGQDWRCVRGILRGVVLMQVGRSARFGFRNLPWVFVLLVFGWLATLIAGGIEYMSVAAAGMSLMPAPWSVLGADGWGVPCRRVMVDRIADILTVEEIGFFSDVLAVQGRDGSDMQATYSVRISTASLSELQQVKDYLDGTVYVDGECAGSKVGRCGWDLIVTPAEYRAIRRQVSDYTYFRLLNG